MFDALNELKEKLCTTSPVADISSEELENFKNNSTVVLAAGGEGSRFGKYAELKDKHKTLLKVNRETLIERIIKMYRDAGIKDFVALVFHEADSIKNLLGDGSSLGVNIRYSHDPGKPVGRGGAILNALEKGILEKEKHMIVHNPDDQVMMEGFVDHIVKHHLAGVRGGGLVTVVAVEGTDYAFSGMKIVNNKVSQIKLYPSIPIPTHIGVTLFDCKALPLFQEHFDLEHRSDFEVVLIPILAKNNQLYAAVIPQDSWYPINNPKQLKKFLEAN